MFRIAFYCGYEVRNEVKPPLIDILYLRPGGFYVLLVRYESVVAGYSPYGDGCNDYDSDDKSFFHDCKCRPAADYVKKLFCRRDIPDTSDRGGEVGF